MKTKNYINDSKNNIFQMIDNPSMIILKMNPKEDGHEKKNNKCAANVRNDNSDAGRMCKTFC